MLAALTAMNIKDQPMKTLMVKCLAESLKEAITLHLSIAEVEKYAQAADLILSIPFDKMQACTEDVSERFMKKLDEAGL